MAFTQTNHTFFQGSSTGTSFSPSFGWTATSGRLLIALVNLDKVISTFTAGWTQKTSSVNWSAMYLYSKISDGTETSVTVTTGSTAGCGVDIFEYTGSTGDNATDGANSGSNTSTVISTPTLTTTNANDLLVVGFGTAPSNTTGAWSALGPSTSSPTWTPTQQDDNKSTDSGGTNKIYMLTAIGEVTATGSYLATATFNSSVGLGALIVAFKGTGAAAQDTPELRGRPYGLRGQNLMGQLLAT